VTGTNTAGCQSQILFSVLVNSSASISVTANPPSVCPGSSSTLTATGVLSYTWLPGNFTGPSVIVNPASVTVYTVIGTFGACTTMATVSVGIGLNPTITPSGNLCNNASIELYA